jgi:hypothetical protein
MFVVNDLTTFHHSDSFSNIAGAASHAMHGMVAPKSLQGTCCSSKHSRQMTDSVVGILIFITTPSLCWRTNLINQVLLILYNKASPFGTLNFLRVYWVFKPISGTVKRLRQGAT